MRKNSTHNVVAHHGRWLPLKMSKSPVKYWFILPLMWLNVLFGSQIEHPGLINFARLLYWVLIFNIACLFFTKASGVRFPKLGRGLLFGVIFFRSVSLVWIEPAYRLYSVCAGLLFGLAGFYFIHNAPNLFKRQITFFIVISVPVMFLQIVGDLEILHYFNTLYVRELSPGYYGRHDITMLPLLFNDYESLMKSGYFVEFRQFLSNQYRIPGLLYSNAILGAVVLVAAIIRLSALLGRRPNVPDYLVVVAVVLTGSKLSFYGFIVLSIITYYSSKSTKRSVLKLLFALAMFSGLYSIIFPSLSGRVFQLASSIGARIFDFMLFLGDSIAFSDIVQSFSWFRTAAKRIDYMGAEGFGGLSGMVSIFYALPFMLVGWVTLGPVYRRQLKRLDQENPETSLLIRLSFAWAVVVLLATPLIGSQFYALLVGVALTPFLIPKSNKVLGS